MKQKIVIISFCVALAWMRAGAATYTVPGNFASIQDAMNNAPDDSTILVAPGTNGYIQALNLNKRLCFKSTAGAAATRVNGGGTSMLLRIENGGSYAGDPFMALTFDGFTFENGMGIVNTFAPVVAAGANVTFLNCVFQNNYSPDKGGAVLVFGVGGQATFVNCLFQYNWTDLNAGAAQINGDESRGYFKDCVFLSNTCRTPSGNEGGAIVFAAGNGEVVNCTFRSNSANYAGGAIICTTPFTYPMNTVLVSGCVFDGNFAQRAIPDAALPPTEGGAIVAEHNMNVIVSGCVFTNCHAMSAGAVSCYQAALRVQDSVFDNCVASGTNLLGSGGAIGANSYDPNAQDNPNASLWIENCAIRNCTAPAGGAIFAQGDFYHGTDAAHRTPVTLRNVVMDNCRATTAGNSYGNGGGMNFNLANVQATNLYILNCVAEHNGGGFEMVQNTSMTLNNSFIVGCSASVQGSSYDCPVAPFPVFMNSVQAYNKGSGTASLSSLLAAPTLSFGPRSYLTYLDLPYSSSASISPRIGALPNRGGFAAGIAVDTAMTSNTTYALSSQFSAKQAGITYTPYGIVGVPYGGTPPVLPAVIEAENFNTLGSHISYGDSSPANLGGAYRPGEGVDIAADSSAGGGYAVGWIEAGEWMEYDFKVAHPDVFGISTRVASPAGGGSFYLQLDGADVTGTINVPSTGGWSSWQNVTLPNAAIAAGDHILRFVAVSSGFNMDSIRFNSSGPVLAVAPGSLTRTVKVGSDAAAQAIQITNSGGSNMPFVITDSAAWLSVAPTNSAVASGASTSAVVSYATAGLATGDYSAVITITASVASGSPAQIPVTLRVRPAQTVAGDFDGDASADIAVFWPAGGAWNVLKSSSQQNLPFQLGWSADVPVVADYDGDGKADFAVFDPTVGNWYIIQSSTGNLLMKNWGWSREIPVPADYDGDGKTDIAVFDPPTGMWYILLSSTGQMRTQQWGWSQAIPVPADYDGDGKADIATYVPGTGSWAILQSSNGQARVQNWGWFQAMPVPADYDGDGRADIATYVPGAGQWHILRSSDGGLTQQNWGWSMAAPVPADYDGDGKADIATYTPAAGLWFVLKSSDGGMIQQNWGWSQAVPVAPQFQINRRYFPNP